MELGELLEGKDVEGGVVELVVDPVEVAFLWSVEGGEARGGAKQALEDGFRDVRLSGVAELDVREGFRLLRVLGPRAAGRDDDLRLLGDDLFHGQVARGGL